jgi:RNA polymerase sigma-70 factor, ECF subfamily
MSDEAELMLDGPRDAVLQRAGGHTFPLGPARWIGDLTAKPDGTGATISATFRAAGPSEVFDDYALSQALVAGDDHAFRSLVERETSRIFRVCYRILGRVDEAEEATQETFVLAYRALGTFRGDGHPTAWLVRIATRESWRVSAARSRREANTKPIDDIAFTLRSTVSDPLAETIAAEDRGRVRDAVTSLPEPYREVITLRYFAELSLLEICAATARPVGTVKAQLHRGLERLRVVLQDPGR